MDSLCLSRGNPKIDRSSRLCGRRRGAVAGALGAQLRPKRGRSASRGLPRAARRPGAPPRPRRRRPAALRRQRRSTEVNGAAEPRRLPLQVLRPPAAGRGDGPNSRGGRFETLHGAAGAGELPAPVAGPSVLRWLLVFTMGERHFSTGCIKLIATVEARLEDEEDPPAPTALAACQAWYARPQRPKTVRPAP